MFFWTCDYQLWFSPLFEDIARSWAEGEWPILTQGSWATGNLAGEYQCGTFSLFFNACLVALWKLPLSLPAKAAALSTMHLIVLAAGTALLARRRLSTPAAVVAALAVSMNGWMINWAATEWFVALSGFAWVPWSWWACEVACESRSSRIRWLLPAPFIYLTLTAGSPFAALMLAAVLAWLLTMTFFKTESLRSVAPILFGIAAGLGLSAPAWLMLIEYHQGSTRAAWGSEIQWNWIVPAKAWLGLVLPSFTTPWRHWEGAVLPHFCIEMAGGLVPFAACCAAVSASGRAWIREHRWELALLTFAVIIVSVPSVGSFRWSYRWMPLFHLTLALLGAKSLDRVSPSRTAVWALGLTALAAGVAALSGANASPAFTIAQLALCAVWFFSAKTRWRSWSAPVATAAILLATYCFLPTTQAVSRYPFRENMLETGPLETDRLYLSVHTFGDLLNGGNAAPGWGAILRPCNTPLLAHLHFLNGYTSFSAKGIPALFDTHGSLHPETAEALLSPKSASLLDLLGVDGLVFGPHLMHLTHLLGPEWVSPFESPEAKVYHRESTRSAPVKTLRHAPDHPGIELAQPDLQIQTNRRRTVSVRVEPAPDASSEIDEDLGILLPAEARAAPSVIAFIRPFYSGYRATFDSRPVPVGCFEGIIPTVELPPDSEGTLILRYEPMALRAGLTSSALTVVILLGVAVSGRFFNSKA